MEVGCEDVKERSPMFPRLNVKDAEDKVVPKAPPRNKMALYEQSKFNTPTSQTISSGSTPKLPPFLRKDLQVSSLSGHVESKQGIQSCNSGVSCYKAEKLHAYQSRTVNLTKLMPEGHIGSRSSVKNYEHDDALVTPVSAHRKMSSINISQNEEDEETKLVLCESSCSLTSQNPFRKVNSTRPIKLTSDKYEKNQVDDHIEVNHIDLTEEGLAHPLAGYGYMTDESSISSVRIRAPRPIKKAYSSFMEDFRSISADSLKRLQCRNGQTNEDNTAFGDKINVMDDYLEKPATRGVDKCPDVLEIGRNFFWGKRDGHKSEDTYRHYDVPTLSKNMPDYAVGTKITPGDVIRVIGEKQFWRARRTIINQQRIFIQQVSELHRLMKVQKLIAGSPRLLIQNQLLLGKPLLKAPAPKKLQSAYVTEQPPSNAKPNTKFEKPTDQCAGITLLPLPGIHNMSKGPSVQLPNYGSQSENNPLALPTPTNNTKPSPCYIYPAPGNQWLMPFMSPEGLIYKPIVGSCPPNAGFMGPVYGSCNPISLTPGNKDVQEATHVPYIFPPYVPPVMHPTSLPVFAHEQMSRPPTKMQSKGPTENHQSTGAVNSSILYQSSSIMSSQVSQVMSIHVTDDNNTSEDREVQISSTCSSPRKRMKGDILPLFPTAPTFGASSDQQKAQAVEENQPCIVKAIPHNPKSTTESASRIFMSIQEERHSGASSDQKKAPAVKRTSGNNKENYTSYSKVNNEISS